MCLETKGNKKSQESDKMEHATNMSRSNDPKPARDLYQLHALADWGRGTRAGNFITQHNPHTQEPNAPTTPGRPHTHLQ